MTTSNIQPAIIQLSESYVSEALHSPQLFADMAAMERYMAESYGERVLIELLQNADDALSTQFYIGEVGPHIVIANDGKPFNEQDLQAICRSGSSSKKRGESIGYRGVGFKSTTYLTDTIYIHSNDCTFSFSKKLAAEKLQLADISKVPTVRIPFLATLDVAISNYIRPLKEKGYTTFFIFTNAKKDVFLQELEAMKADYFIFLRNLLQVHVNMNKPQQWFISRQQQTVKIQYELWEQQWFVISGSRVQLAFALNDQQEITTCDEKTAVFHCYLPTLEASPFLCKINGDFSTDPSRKHITLDNTTIETLQDGALLLFEWIKEEIHNPKISELLNVLQQQSMYGKIARHFNERFQQYIESPWIEMKNGQFISPKQWVRKPDILSPSEWTLVRKATPLIATVPNVSEQALPSVDQYFDKMATCTYDAKDWLQMLQIEAFVKAIPPLTLVKLYSECLLQIRNKELLYGESIDFTKCYIRKNQLLTLEDAPTEALIDFCNSLNDYMSESELQWLKEKLNLTAKSIKQDDDPFAILQAAVRPTSTSNAQPRTEAVAKPVTSAISKILTKWRAAEQQCVEFEQSLGNKAKDVSKQNVGYDVYSVTPDGTERFIEVKSINPKNRKISITNNEYSTAHLKGDNYYICVVYSEGDQVIFEYIANPLANLSLEKVIRQWEWICESFQGEKFIIE